MADVNVKVNLDDGGSIQTLGELEQNLDSLKESIRGVEVGSDEFKRLSSEISNTESKVKDLELGFEGLDIEQKSSEMGSFASGMADTATGALALSSAMGITNKSSEEMIESMVSGMAVAQTFRGGLDGIVSAQKLLRSSTIASTVATKGGTVATRIFNSVVKANPVMLLVGAIGAAVGAFALFSGGVDESNEKLEENNKKKEEAAKLAKENRQELAKETSGFVSLVSQLKNTNANSETRKELIKEINDEYGTTLKNIEDETKFQDQLNASLQQYIDKKKEQIRFKANEEAITGLIERQIKLEDQLTKSAEKTGISVEELRESYSDLSEDRTYSNRVQRDVKALEELEEINKELLDIGADQVDLRKEGANESKNNTEANNKERKSLEQLKKERNEAYEGVISLAPRAAKEIETSTKAQQRNNSTTANAIALMAKMRNELDKGFANPNEEDKSELELAQERAQSIMENQRANLENRVITKREFARRELEVEEWLAGEEKKIQKERAMFAIDQTGNMFSTMASFAEEGSAASKTFAMASIIADSASALMKSVPVALEAAKATGPAAPFVFAGTLAGIIGTVVGTAANAKKVLSDSPGPSAGGGGGGNISSPNTSSTQQPEGTPDVNLFGNANKGSEGDASMFNTKDGNGPKQVQAVVQWSDIESVQSADNNIQNEMQL